MLLHAWIALPYLAIGSGLSLAAAVAVICLNWEPVEGHGFLPNTSRRRPAFRGTTPRCRLRDPAGTVLKPEILEAGSRP